MTVDRNANSPVTPFDNQSQSTRQPPRQEPVNTPSSPFDDGIPMLDLSTTKAAVGSKSRTKIKSKISRSKASSHTPSSRRIQQGLPKNVSKPLSRIPVAHGGRVRTFDSLPTQGPRKIPITTKDNRNNVTHAPVLPPLRANSDIVGSKLLTNRIQPGVSSYSKDGEIVRPRARAVSLDPKLESDDEDDSEVLARAADMVRQARLEQEQEHSVVGNTAGGKRKRASHMDDDPFLSRSTIQKTARRQRVGPSLSLEQEMRFAEAQESAAAAIDFIEQDQHQYFGAGARRSDLGFMKGGGAGGRAVWSSIAS